MKFTAE